MKRKVALLLTVFMAASGIAGSSTIISAEENKEPVKLTFWYWADTPEQSELMQSIVEEYNNTNTMNVTVTAEENAWNDGGYTEDMYVAVAGGGGPDISTFRSSAAAMYYNGDYLLNLTDMVNEWEDKEAIPDSFWNVISQSTATEGEYYLIPWTTETLYVYYRPSYFEEAGIEVPETYEDFIEAIEKCTMDTDGDGETDVYGLALRAGGGYEPWYYFIQANGGSFEDLTSEESIKGMDAFKSIYANGWAPETAVTDAYSEVMANFKAGTCAMVIHHIGSSVDMVDTFGDDVAAFTLPPSESGNAWDAMTDSELAIMSSTKYPEECFDFAEYMSTGKGQEMWFEGTNKCNQNSIITSREDYQANEFLRVTNEGMEHAGVFPYTNYVSEFISTSWLSITQQVLQDQVTVAEGMELYKEALYGEE